MSSTTISATSLIPAARLRAIDTDFNTRVLSLMQDGQEYKTWCYAVQKWVKVTRAGDQFAVKFGRKLQTLTLEQAVAAIVDASQGPADSLTS